MQAHIGVAPYDVLTTGASHLFHIPIGVASFGQAAVFLGVALALRARLALGTLICVVGPGPVLGLLLHVLPEPAALVPRTAMYSLGFTLIALGVTAVVVADLGSGPAELTMIALHDRGIPLARARTALEVLWVAAGWAMGGQVGAGTLAFVVLIGPVLHRTIPAARARF